MGARHPFLTHNDLKKATTQPSIPCHRILIETAPKSIFNLHSMRQTVIGHVHLKDSIRSLNTDKLRKMLAGKMSIKKASKNRAKNVHIDWEEPTFYDDDGQ